MPLLTEEEAAGQSAVEKQEALLQMASSVITTIPGMAREPRVFVGRGPEILRRDRREEETPTKARTAYAAQGQGELSQRQFTTGPTT